MFLIMTNYILDDGTYVDVGQVWTCEGVGEFTIIYLDNFTEQMFINDGEISWSNFKLRYENEVLYRYDIISPKKYIIPYCFTTWVFSILIIMGAYL